MEQRPGDCDEQLSAFLEGLISQRVLAIDVGMSSFLSDKAPVLKSSWNSNYYDVCFESDLYMPASLGGYKGKITHTEKAEEKHSAIYINNPPNLLINGRQVTEIDFRTPIYFKDKKEPKKRNLDPKHKFHLSLSSLGLPPEIKEKDPLFAFDLYQFFFDSNGKLDLKFINQCGTIPIGTDIDAGDLELIAPVVNLLLSFIQNAKPKEESLG